MNISSVQGSQLIYQAFLTNKLSNKQSVNASSELNQSTSQSSVSPLRDRMLAQINSLNGNEQNAEQLLQSYSRPNNSGILVAADDMPDLKDTEAMRRFERISSAFEAENSKIEQQKSELIAQERQEGKSAEEIVNDVVSFYDSQSDLYKLGIGWEGNLFSFNNSSSSGWERTLQYSSSVVDTFS